MLNHGNVMISVSNSNRFLEIEKKRTGNYIVKLGYITSIESILSVFELLKVYGDVFAAFVENIDPKLELSQKEKLIKNFPVIMENTKVIVAKFDTTYCDHNTSDANVDKIENIVNHTEYQGHLYIFTKAE